MTHLGRALSTDEHRVVCIAVASFIRPPGEARYALTDRGRREIARPMGVPADAEHA